MAKVVSIGDYERQPKASTDERPRPPVVLLFDRRAAHALVARSYAEMSVMQMSLAMMACWRAHSYWMRAVTAAMQEYQR
jgi:hypothetical protein